MKKWLPRSLRFKHQYSVPLTSHLPSNGTTRDGIVKSKDSLEIRPVSLKSCKPLPFREQAASLFVPNMCDGP